MPFPMGYVCVLLLTAGKRLLANFQFILELLRTALSVKAHLYLFCRSHNLAYLSVCYCEHISEAGIELLGQTHSLVSLDISGCACGDQGLSALGNNTRFKDVTLAECHKVTDLGLQKFAQQCKDINRLSLAHCKVRVEYYSMWYIGIANLCAVVNKGKSNGNK